jgi:hypothetical protein
MKSPSTAIPINLEYHLGLIEKQSKRIYELARFLPFADQQQEMERVATDLMVAASVLRDGFPGIEKDSTGEWNTRDYEPFQPSDRK